MSDAVMFARMVLDWWEWPMQVRVCEREVNISFSASTFILYIVEMVTPLLVRKLNGNVPVTFAVTWPLHI